MSAKMLEPIGLILNTCATWFRHAAGARVKLAKRLSGASLDWPHKKDPLLGSSMVERRALDADVAGSSPAPATTSLTDTFGIHSNLAPPLPQLGWVLLLSLQVTGA